MTERSALTPTATLQDIASVHAIVAGEFIEQLSESDVDRTLLEFALVLRRGRVRRSQLRPAEFVVRLKRHGFCDLAIPRNGRRPRYLCRPFPWQAAHRDLHSEPMDEISGARAPTSSNADESCHATTAATMLLAPLAPALDCKADDLPSGRQRTPVLKSQTWATRDTALTERPRIIEPRREG